MQSMRFKSPKAHWMYMGRTAACLGHSLAQALTNHNDAVDAWITAGYNSMMRKINKREREALGSAETYALVKSKLGI